MRSEMTIMENIISDNRVELSFVVPVYNTSKANFKRCINSIISLEIQNKEIIVIDDGSGKEYAEFYDILCSEYLATIVFHVENCGAAAARNIGIQKAKGEYICFVDSDDYISKNGEFELALKHIINTKSDVLFGCNNKRGPMDFFDELTINDLQIVVLEQKIINESIQIGSPWAKIFRRYFLISNNLFFDSELRRSHDRMFILNVLEAQPKYCFINKVLYHFCDDEADSLSKCWNPKTKDYLLKYLRACEFFVNTKHLNSSKFMFALSELEMILFRQCLHQVVFHPQNKCGLIQRYHEFEELRKIFISKKTVSINYISKGMYIFSLLIKRKMCLLAYICLEVDRFKKKLEG